MNNIGEFPEIDKNELKRELHSIVNNRYDHLFGELNCYLTAKIKKVVKKRKSEDCSFCRYNFNQELKYKYPKSKLVKLFRAMEVYMYIDTISKFSHSILDYEEQHYLESYFKDRILAFDNKLGWYIKLEY